jgi:hypothetical protein
MSRKVLVPLGLLSLATDPTGYDVGDSYWNSVQQVIRTYNGSQWVVSSGVQGVQGTDGTQGANGSPGNIGTQGTQGIQGVQGSQGIQGTDGIQGIEGTQGVQGTQGTQGVQGVQGVQGTTGTQGVQGTQGTQGVQGQEGVGTQGTLGTQGTQGVMGTSGFSSSNFNYRFDTSTADSSPGAGKLRFNNATQTSATFLYIDHINDSGVDIDVLLGLLKTDDSIIVQDKANSNVYITFKVTAAITVVTNDYVKVPVTSTADGGSGSNSFGNNDALEVITFTTGLQGPIGAQGSVGPQGTQGIQGTEGTQGVQGTQGTQGTQGNNGVQGFDGTQGVQGIQGTQGVQGTTGAGTQGTQGTQGTLGTQGTQGVQGPASSPVEPSGTTSGTVTTSAQMDGYLGIPQNPEAASGTYSYTLTASDAGKHIYYTGTPSSATLVIPANSSVAFEIGTTIVVMNDLGAATNLSISITTDTLQLAGTGTTGTRTLARYGVASMVKVTGTKWVISGNGLS